MYNKNFKKDPTMKQVIGEIGENSACAFLEKHGHIVVERNYSRKWGELDIVSKMGNVLHFVEVKSVTGVVSDVTHETYSSSYRPEDNMHPRKLDRLSRTIQTYILERNVSDETEWQFDLITVIIDMDKRLSRVSMIEDIVIG